MLARTSPGVPLAEQQQEDGQRHRLDSTLDPLIHRVHENPRENYAFFWRDKSAWFAAKPAPRWKHRSVALGGRVPGGTPHRVTPTRRTMVEDHLEDLMAETQAGKVDRYIEEGRVTKQLELPDGGSVWRINADTGTYRLTIDDVGVEWQCTCPAALRGRSDCAHAWAVLKLMGLEPEPR